MEREFSRTELLIGENSLNKIKSSNVIVFGVGGVGSFVAEALVRSGIGNITIVDNDVVSISNINRQLIALQSTIGMPKVDVMKDRMLDINPKCNVVAINKVYHPDTSEYFKLEQFDYIIDAIDMVTGKIDLVVKADKLNIPIISAMGAGNKLNPTLFEVSDIYKTSVCPLAKVMRKELKKRGISKLKVVYSKEKPRKPLSETDTRTPASVAFVPSVSGLIIASEVIKDIINMEGDINE